MGRKKIERLFSKTVALGLVAVLGLGATGIGEVAASETASEEVSQESESNDSYSYDAADYDSERIANNYTKVSAGYTLPVYEKEAVEISTVAAVTDAGDAKETSETRDYEKSDKVLDLTTGNTITLQIEVPEDR